MDRTRIFGMCALDLDLGNMTLGQDMTLDQGHDNLGSRS